MQSGPTREWETRAAIRLTEREGSALPSAPRVWRSTLGERPECECPEWCRLDHEHD